MLVAIGAVVTGSLQNFSKHATSRFRQKEVNIASEEAWQ